MYQGWNIRQGCPLRFSLLTIGLCVVLGSSAQAGELSRPRGQVRPGAIALPRPREYRRAGATELAHATRREVRATGFIGRIEIPRLGLSAPVSEGTSERVLSRSVGHAPRTSFPGEPGNVGLAAHRHTHFRKLEGIARGDWIRLRTPDGEFKYEVQSILIVTPDRGDLLKPTPEKMLTLVTCYPFRYVGHAPKRFIVRARQVDSAEALAGASNLALGN